MKPDYKFEMKRWEDGVDHHPMSEELMEWMMDVDFNTGDSLCLKKGGDGDNGEALMFLMDGFFENLDTTAEIQRLLNALDDAGWAQCKKCKTLAPKQYVFSTCCEGCATGDDE